MADSYSALAQTFDRLAAHYDAAFGPAANQSMAWMRRENLALLQATFPPGAFLLEIGCGTGDEALFLAQKGSHLLATDISPRMAAITRRKAAAAGLSGRINAAALPAGGLNSLRPGELFDGAFASFGSLNCEPDLDRLARDLAGLLKPGANFVCTVMCRFHFFELLWFLVHAQPQTARRRLKSGWQSAGLGAHGAGRLAVSVRYLSASDLQQAFDPYFSIVRVFSLGLFMPPPYLDELYRKFRPLWQKLAALEYRLRERWPWRTMGDHIALVLEKR